MAKAKVKENDAEVRFEHMNRYLFVGELGIQFIDGVYVTDNEVEIAYLRALEGIREV